MSSLPAYASIAPPFPYFGGKQRVARRIVDMFPDHAGYVEPYAGGLSVLFAKAPVAHEVVNDLNDHLVTFWRVLRDQEDELVRVCAATPHARSEFDLASSREGVSDLEVARRVWVLLTQGRSAIWKSTGWRHYSDGGASTGFAVYMDAYRERLRPAAARLRDVQIECRPAVDVIRSYGKHSTNLLYVDPPYLGSVRRNAARYDVEMTGANEHHLMLDALLEADAAVVLSGYANELYDGRLGGWARVEVPARTQGAARTEVLWMNAAAAFGAGQSRLFELEGSA